MKYYAPLNQLDDIAGGTLIAGVVPLARAVSEDHSLALGADVALTTSYQDILVPVAITPVSAGDLYLLYTYVQVARVSGTNTPDITINMTYMAGFSAGLISLGGYASAPLSYTVTYPGTTLNVAMGFLGYVPTAGDLGFKLQVKRTAATDTFNVKATTTKMTERFFRLN